MDEGFAEEAGVKRLREFADLNIIYKYGKEFGMPPREVLNESFDNVMPFFVLWAETESFNNKLRKIKQSFNDNTNRG